MTSRPHLRFSFELPTQRVESPAEFVTADAVAELTQAASAAGFSSVHLSDHPAPDARWLDLGGHHTMDPFVTLAFAAAAEPAIQLLTNVFVPAYRNPFLAAKLVQSLDVLSGGRLVLGVAAGYLRPEFAAVGADFERRGELLDEALAVLDAAYSGKDVAWQGHGFEARGVRMRPIPRDGKRPSVWVGGNSKAAMRRAARFDGWSPFYAESAFAGAARTKPLESPEQLEEAIRFVLAERPEANAGAPFDVCWSEPISGDPRVSADARIARLEALRRAGVTWIAVNIPGEDRVELAGGIAAFGRDIISESRRL